MLKKTITTPRKYKDIQFFSSNNNTILPNGEYYVNLDERFKPYQEVLITNNTEYFLKVVINLSKREPLPPKSSIKIDTPVNELSVINTSANNILANQLEVHYRHYSQKQEQVNNALTTINTFGAISNIFRR